MSVPCSFCEIAADGASPAVIHADDQIVAFLDHAPIRQGHLQIIPRVHYPYFDDLPTGLAARILSLGQRFAKVMKPLYRVERVAFVFTGNEVGHAHAHLIPLHEATDVTSRRYIAEADLTFAGRPRLSTDETAEVAAELRAAIGGSS